MSMGFDLLTNHAHLWAALDGSGSIPRRLIKKQIIIRYKVLINNYKFFYSNLKKLL